MPKKPPELRLTVRSFCSQNGLSERSVASELRRLGAVRDKSGYALSDLCKAAYGDLYRARLREQQAKTEMIERENRHEAGELLNRDEAKKQFAKYIGIIAGRVNTLPHVYAARANPSDPKTSMLALEEARAYILQPLDDYEDQERNRKSQGKA